jgi:hypothetical protein
LKLRGSGSGAGFWRFSGGFGSDLEEQKEGSSENYFHYCGGETVEISLPTVGHSEPDSRAQGENMSESVVSTTRPVSDFTGHCPVNPETLKKEFEELNSAAHEQATLVPVACAALGTALDELMPILAKMQSLLSQRGENRDLFRDAEIPTWSEWWKSYKKETGLRSCLRTVQRKLKEHRSLGKPVEESSKRPVPPLHLSSRDQRRVLKALQYANEMADALNHDHEYRGFLREYNRVALDSDNIEQMLENIPVEAEFGVISRGHTAPASAAPALAEVPEAPPRGQWRPFALCKAVGSLPCFRRLSVVRMGYTPALRASLTLFVSM